LGKHKFKIFFWLLLRDRLNSRNLLRRKNMELEDYSCVLCNTGHEETSFFISFLNAPSVNPARTRFLLVGTWTYNHLTW
jgi:hypothetical protein